MQRLLDAEQEGDAAGRADVVALLVGLRGLCGFWGGTGAEIVLGDERIRRVEEVRIRGGIELGWRGCDGELDGGGGYARGGTIWDGEYR